MDREFVTIRRPMWQSPGALELENVSLVTVRDVDTGRCFGFFKDHESALRAVAVAGIENWVAEQRHPTLEEIDHVFAAEQRANSVPFHDWQFHKKGQ